MSLPDQGIFLSYDDDDNVTVLASFFAVVSLVLLFS